MAATYALKEAGRILVSFCHRMEQHYRLIAAALAARMLHPALVLLIEAAYLALYHNRFRFLLWMEYYPAVRADRRSLQSLTMPILRQEIKEQNSALKSFGSYKYLS